MSASTDDAQQTEQYALPPVHESWLPTAHPLHRPRHGTTQRTALVCALAFFCTPLLLLVLGVRAPTFENRALASFPAPSDGWGFFTGMSAWAADHLPLRDHAVNIEDLISRRVFGEPPALGQQTGQGPIQGPIAPNVTDEDRERMREAGFPKVIEGRDDWLYLGYDMLGACLPERSLDDVIAALQRLRSAVESSGRKFVLVVAPDKSTMVPEYLPRSYVGSQCAGEARDAFWRRITNEEGSLDVRPALRQAAERRGAPVYSRVDTHWTYEGGLAMTRMLADDIQPGVTTSWRATPAEVVKRSGDLPPLIGRSAEFPLQTYDLAPDGTTVRSRAINSAFRTPLNLSQRPGRGVVSAPVGLVADSYSLFAVPYLAGGFADLSVIHSDTAGVDPRSVGALFAGKDVVVVEAVERSIISGIHPLLNNEVIDAMGDELAKHPRG